MTTPRLCRNPACDSEWTPTAWLNPWFCTDTCREVWCKANGRTADGTPIVPDADLVEEQLVAAFATHEPPVIQAPSGADVLAGMQELARTLKAFTPAEWEVLKAARPSSALTIGIYHGEIGAFTGTPIVVEPDPIPKRGWLDRVLRRLFR